MGRKGKASIRKAVRSLKVTNFVDHREYLGAVYALTKADQESYSYLKFADDLGFGAINMMRLIIVGERPLTAKTALRVATALDLHGDERRYFMSMVKYGHATKPEERDKHFQMMMACKSLIDPDKLDEAQVRYFGDWFIPVIREMAAMKGFRGDAEWIRSRILFPVRLDQIKRALELLVELGYLTFDPRTDVYERAGDRVHTPFEVDSLALVRYHQKMIEIGKESITRVDEEKRDVQALTAYISEESIPRLKAEIQKLMDVMEGEETREGGRVYQLNVQLFPFTKN